VTQALTASVLPQPARKPGGDAAALIRPAGQAPPVPGQRRRAPGAPRTARGKPGPEVPPGREVSVMMTSSSQPPDLDRYLARHGFRPQTSHSTWLDRDNGQHVIRVVREPEEQTQLICLAPRSACVYQAVFSLGTPDAVIIAAVEAALSPAPPQAAGTRPGRPRAGHGPTAHARRKAVTGDDDR
jgi:hypothetical protein